MKIYIKITLLAQRLTRKIHLKLLSQQKKWQNVRYTVIILLAYPTHPKEEPISFKKLDYGKEGTDTQGLLSKSKTKATSAIRDGIYSEKVIPSIKRRDSNKPEIKKIAEKSEIVSACQENEESFSVHFATKTTNKIHVEENYHLNEDMDLYSLNADIYNLEIERH